MNLKTYLLLFLMGFLFFSSCSSDELNMDNPRVDKFVKILKSGDYFNKVGYELPNFKVKHIEGLLSYCNDTTIVNTFPSNPISSKLTNPKILGECLLWTIDGIRTGRKYPSLEPNLIDISSITSGYYKRISRTELIEVTKLYNQWFDEYQKNPTDLILKKNILENTPYRWN